MSKWLSNFVMDTRVRRTYDFLNSYHRLLIARVRIPKFKAMRMNFQKLKPQPKPNVKLLENSTICKTFIKELNSELEKTQPRHSSEPCEALVETLKVTVEKTLPKVKRPKGEVQIWNTDERLRELIAERRKIDRNSNLSKFRKITQEIKKQLNKIRNDFYRQEAQKVNEAFQSQELENLYKLCREHNILKTKPKSQVCPGMLKYFESHFNHDSPKVTPE